jgi:hypothetical protein
MLDSSEKPPTKESKILGSIQQTVTSPNLLYDSNQERTHLENFRQKMLLLETLRKGNDLVIEKMNSKIGFEGAAPYPDNLFTQIYDSNNSFRFLADTALQRFEATLSQPDVMYYEKKFQFQSDIISKFELNLEKENLTQNEIQQKINEEKEKLANIKKSYLDLLTGRKEQIVDLLQESLKGNLNGMNFDVEPVSSPDGQKSFADIAKECGNVTNSAIVQRQTNIRLRIGREIATTMVFYNGVLEELKLQTETSK